MSKISIEDVEQTLLSQKIEPAKVSSIIKELNEVIEETKSEKVTLPKTKNEFLIILSDPNGELKDKELTGWVITQRQGDDAATALDKIRTAAKSTDEAKKRKKSIMTTFGEAMQNIKRKFIKDTGIMIKSKNPVRVLITGNKL